ncbi:MAG: hypothetical protein ACREFC_09395 [Stellaceae bacterium]
MAAICLSSGIAQAAGPVILLDNQLDSITAGLTIGVATAAFAGGGPVSVTATNGFASGHTTKLPNGGNEQTGVAGGTATAISPGGDASTGAASSGSVTGHTLANIGVHGTVSGAGGSLSVGFTFVTGGTLAP